MLLRYSLDEDEAADAVDAAVWKVLEVGYRTADILTAGTVKVGTRKMGDLVAERV